MDPLHQFPKTMNSYIRISEFSMWQSQRVIMAAATRWCNSTTSSLRRSATFSAIIFFFLKQYLNALVVLKSIF